MSGNSVFLARLIGPVLIVAAIALFIDRKGFRAMAEEFLASRALLYLSGFLIMPAGLAIVLTHNIWVANGSVVITVIGWLMAFSGAVRILIPDKVAALGRAFLKQPMSLCIAAGVWLAAGITLCLFGYNR